MIIEDIKRSIIFVKKTDVKIVVPMQCGPDLRVKWET